MVFVSGKLVIRVKPFFRHAPRHGLDMCCMLQGFWSGHCYYGGYHTAADQDKWKSKLASMSTEAIADLGLDCLNRITSLERAFVGDPALQLSAADIERIQELTLSGDLEKELTSCYHECVYTGILRETTNIKDLHVLPTHHAFFLGVFKTFFKDIIDQKVSWGGKSVSLRSLLWLYNERLTWLQTTSDFGRAPNIIIAIGKNKGTGTLFPHWTCEDYSDHALLYIPLLMR